VQSEKGLEGKQDPGRRTGFPCLRLGGLQQKQKEIPFKSEQNQQMIREEERGANLSILLSL
jgi:hypothetical protein